MSKRKKSKKFRAEGAVKWVLDLEAISRLGRADSETARSLLRWYTANGFWTPKQQALIKFLVVKQKGDTHRGKSKYHLYAISDGESVKLGVSTDVRKRMKSMQTGHPKELSIIWKYFTGTNKTKAYGAERKLHKFCKQYSIRGEWFKSSCMDIVRRFSL